jgi:hypothetical protein
MRAVIVESWDELEAAGAGAVFRMDEGHLIIRCPGCGQMSELRVGPGEDHPRWILQGWPDRATLTPSVHHARELGGCGWHGWLRNGAWVSC